jgi:hypothetical protein
MPHPESETASGADRRKFLAAWGKFAAAKLTNSNQVFGKLALRSRVQNWLRWGGSHARLDRQLDLANGTGK